jgi:FKBP-type peptidyl-prolyl cis-trans isomerase
MKALVRFTFPLVLAAGVLSCGGDGTSVEDPPKIEETEFAESLGVDLALMTKTATGLYYRDLVVSEGPTATVGVTVRVRYTGWLSSGTQFDSNQGNGIAFQLGSNQVVKGFDEGIRGMRVGGQRQLIIPPSLGYGSGGSGVIPGNAILVFRVELVSIQ